MLIKDAREAYYYNTGKLGDVGRQVAFAGIGVIWLFHTTTEVSKVTQYGLPGNLRLAAGLICAGLVADLAQYLVASVIWGGYARWREKSFQRQGIDPTAPQSQFDPPAAINVPALALLAAKVSLIVGGLSLTAWHAWISMGLPP